MNAFQKTLSSAISIVIFLFLTGSVCTALETKMNLSAAEKIFLNNHPKISVSNEFDWPPFDFTISGKPTGFGIDLMNLLADRIGVKFTYVNGYTWDELVKMFNKGKIDVIHSLSITPERSKIANFSNPYYHSKNVLILRNDNININTLEALSGKIIALPSGWSSIGFFKKYYPDIHIIEVSSSRQALEYVDQGKVTATVEQEGIARYFIKKFGFPDLSLSKWIDNNILQATSSMHFAVLKKNPMLFQILSKALRSIKPEEIDALEQKWFSRKGRQIGKEDVGLTPEERSYLKQKGVILFSTVPGMLPFQDLRGENTYGMLADFSEIFSERLNIPFKPVKSTSVQNSIQLLKTRQCDIIPMLIVTSEEKKSIDFTSPYLNHKIAIIAREKLRFISGLEDMNGEKVGIVNDIEMVNDLGKKFQKIKFIPMKTAKDAILKLSAGKTDALLLSLAVATHNIRELGVTNLKVAGYTKLRGGYRIGVKKENKILHSIMSKLVRSISRNDVDEIYNKWVTLKFQHQLNYAQLLKYGGIALGVILLILLWTLKLASLNRQLGASHKKLKQLSITDGLTGLFNRRHLEKSMGKELNRVKRYKHDLSVIILDIDNFKSVNDNYGHQMGDLVLINLASMLQEKTRKTDVTGRWGGEEFVILCTETGHAGAVHLATNLKESIQQLLFEHNLKITASFGVSTWAEGDTADSLVSRADEALYQAKNTGRNKVIAL